jgi:hypothetical protein
MELALVSFMWILIEIILLVNSWTWFIEYVSFTVTSHSDSCDAHGLDLNVYSHESPCDAHGLYRSFQSLISVFYFRHFIFETYFCHYIYKLSL